MRVDVSGGAIADPAERLRCYVTFPCLDFQVPQLTRTTSAELIWTSKGASRFKYVAGVFAFRGNETAGTIINPDVLPNLVNSDTGVITHSYAAFAEGAYDLLDSLALTVGGRYSHDRKKGTVIANRVTAATPIPGPDAGWGSFTPRYKLDPSSNLYFTYSKGFKSGVINPVIVLPGSSTEALVAAPESLDAFEVGFKKGAHRLSLAASAFYYQYKDIQVQNFSGLTILTSNAAKASIYGIDVDATWNVSDEFSLRAAGSWLPKAKYNDFDGAIYYVPPLSASGLTTYSESVAGKRLLRTPKITANLTGHYKRSTQAGAFDATVSVYYTSRSPLELGYRVYAKAHEQINATFGFTSDESRFSVAFFANNITNKAFVQGLVPTAAADMAVYNPPRQVGFTLKYGY